MYLNVIFCNRFSVLTDTIDNLVASKFFHAHMLTVVVKCQNNSVIQSDREFVDMVANLIDKNRRNLIVQKFIDNISMTGENGK